ncbi:hypothetical protein [Desulfogranum mediterraneum]|uniref:hypothetical protein n=1 Tax=Desulfogranum mediterraneum TaxID=160661 RepID=UPI0003F5BD40|nr:hypothetical protein [Desulfogranum mediterraneum]
MITYLYWLAVILVIAALLYLFSVRGKNWKVGAILGLIVFIVSWGAYYFRFQQVFVKRYGGVMTIHVPEGQRHLAATWKDDNLWIENYDPSSNTCYFTEYSKGNVLQGKVTIKECSPLMPQP